MFTKIVKHRLVDNDLKVADLARMLKTSYQNIDQKLKRDNFSEKEMREISKVLGCDLVLDLRDK